MNLVFRRMLIFLMAGSLITFAAPVMAQTDSPDGTRSVDQLGTTLPPVKNNMDRSAAKGSSAVASPVATRTGLSAKSHSVHEASGTPGADRPIREHSQGRGDGEASVSGSAVTTP